MLRLEAKKRAVGAEYGRADISPRAPGKKKAGVKLSKKIEIYFTTAADSQGSARRARPFKEDESSGRKKLGRQDGSSVWRERHVGV